MTTTTNATPHETASASGMASTWSSPDGFCKIQHFANGQRFLFSPTFEFPISLPPASFTATPEERADKTHDDALNDAYPDGQSA
jgi:hypothetical protein